MRLAPRRLALLVAALAAVEAGPAAAQSLVFCRPAAARDAIASPCAPTSSVLIAGPSARAPAPEVPPPARDPSTADLRPRTAALPPPYREPDSRLFIRPVRPSDFFPEESRILMRQGTKDNAVDFVFGVQLPY